jgi:7,8-dihydropterin-6-yl-methyl-4-(beta-D-ribofuranosyl)aminobenzene 5'-phosphate synthase
MSSCAQALVVDTPDGAVVLTGCAHSGVVNILKHVLDKHGRIKAVVDGTHLGLGDQKRGHQRLISSKR